MLIVLDSFEYKKIEKNLRKKLCELCNVSFFYSQYENCIIKYFFKKKYIGNLFSHITYWFLSYWYAITLYIKKEDTRILFINPIVGIFYSLIYTIIGRKKRYITIAGFLFEPKSNKIYYSLRKKIVTFAYKKVDKIVVYSKNEVKYYSQIFPSLKKKFVYIPYGRNYTYSKKINYLSPSKEYIASGGRSNRDYDTLCSAMKLLYEKKININCEIATRPECITNSETSPNISIKYGITLNQFGSFIRNSKFFILPVLDSEISAGHMTLLEVMSIGKPILVSDISAIRDYVSEKDVFFYKAHDAHDLANKVLYLYNNIESDLVIAKAQRAKIRYEKMFSFENFLYRIVSETIKA